MTDLMIGVLLTLTGVDGPGEPATGLTLADIDLYLTAQDRATGVDSVIWDGTQNPTEEMANVGTYTRKLTTADLDLYNYYVSAHYTGPVSLDQDWVNGAIGIDLIPIGTAIEWQYIVYEPDGITPIEGVSVDIHRTAAGTGIPYWSGTTNALGEARDGSGLYPRLDAGTWYFFRRKSGYSFSNPDIETVS
jgi:hypothetical protein